jgi:hypothetical protein
MASANNNNEAWMTIARGRLTSGRLFSTCAEAASCEPFDVPSVRPVTASSRIRQSLATDCESDAT